MILRWTGSARREHDNTVRSIFGASSPRLGLFCGHYKARNRFQAYYLRHIHRHIHATFGMISRVILHDESIFSHSFMSLQSQMVDPGPGRARTTPQDKFRIHSFFAHESLVVIEAAIFSSAKHPTDRVSSKTFRRLVAAALIVLDYYDSLFNPICPERLTLLDHLHMHLKELADIWVASDKSGNWEGLSQEICGFCVTEQYLVWWIFQLHSSNGGLATVIGVPPEFLAGSHIKKQRLEYKSRLGIQISSLPHPNLGGLDEPLSPIVRDQMLAAPFKFTRFNIAPFNRIYSQHTDPLLKRKYCWYLSQ
ncbi:hypothetical protein DFH09DRAFT_1282430 [Mycena vulgaris]|nr:hypothetical protein DFH09DRAFT_1282430 [Mycena vulgaris]